MDSELESLLLDLKDLKETIYKKKCDLVFDITGLQPSEIEWGDWQCNKSPVGKCVYDSIEDPACDCCVFCGQPDERK